MKNQLKLKRILKSVFLGLILLMGFNTSFAQQDAQFTQYMYNTLTINPAYAGQRDGLSVFALHRSQWVGLKGAPVTQIINAHSPIGRNLGGGISVIHDKIGEGTSSETSIDLALSYTIETSYKSSLSFGIKVGGHLLNVDYTKLPGYTNETNLLNIDNKFSPNIGAGIYYSTDRFYAGLSIPNLLETKHFDGSDSSASFISKERAHAFVMMGYVIDINNNLKLKPSTLIKAVTGAPLQTDITLNALFNEKIIFGGAYRWNAAWSALFGYQVTKQLLLGLAYDRETTALGDSSFNNGSYEVFLRYEIRKGNRRFLSPRFF